MEGNLEATEMCFTEECYNISLTEHVTNNEIGRTRRAGTEMKMMDIFIRGRGSWNFLGHAIRKRGLENIVITGQIEGRERQRETKTKRVVSAL